MRKYITIICCTLVLAGYAQSFPYPAINESGESLRDFVPIGWTILDSASGDLNKDGTIDAAIVIQHRDSVLSINSMLDSVLSQPRMLLIIFKNQAENTLVLAEQSNTFILQHDNPTMDDPFQKIIINDGILTITFQQFYTIGSWYVTNALYRFRYQQSQLRLVGAEYSSLHRASNEYENYSYNFLTNKRSYTKGINHKPGAKTTWKTLNIPALKTLKTFRKPFTWEVEKEVYI
ncbi:MAG: hypothetical protein EOO04_21930 [Chitinophagaceae bacterium]|nr:MAG: hypothetical protein EOO04_21930 [Chitinophagaceae bacterium]